MAEQNLDVKVTESGTAVVSSELSKLAGQLDKVTAAQEKETAAATRAAAASEKTAAGVEAFLKAQESKFAVVDRVAGLLGKFNLALELVTKAYEIGKSAVDTYMGKVKDLAPALESVNVKLATQLDLLKKIRAAPGESAAAAGATLAGVTTEQSEKFRGLEAQRQLLLEKIGPLQEEGEKTRRDIRGTDSPFLREFYTDQEAKINAALAQIDEQLLQNEATRKRLEADVATRRKPFETFGPESADPKRAAGRGGDSGDPEAELDALAADAAARLAEAMGPGQSGIAAQLPVMQEFASATMTAAAQIDTLAESYANAAAQGADFAAATGKAALASAVAAAFMGESIAAALQLALENKAIEAGVEALWATGKALYFTATGNPQAGPMFAAAGYFAATAAAAGVGSALAGAAAGGGGGGARGGAPAERDIGPRRQTGADAGGPTTINVQIDGLSLSTAGQVGEAFLGAMERLRNTPGQRARLERVMTGGNR